MIVRMHYPTRGFEDFNYKKRYNFGGKKKEQADPLAGVRGQLQALSSQIPGLVAKQKESIGKTYEGARKEGLINVAEDVHATRGLGRTTLEDRLRTDLLDKLAQGQAKEELAAEQWGLQGQMGALSSMSGMFPQPQQEAGSPWGDLLVGGGALAANLFMPGTGGLVKGIGDSLGISGGGQDVAQRGTLANQIYQLPPASIKPSGSAGDMSWLAGYR